MPLGGRPTRAALLLGALGIAFAFVACGSHDRAPHEHGHAEHTGRPPSANECAYCGMSVATGAPFSVSHNNLRFDSVKCFLGYTLEHTNTDRNAALAVEYYSARSMRLSELALVENSDVMGPMGKDFIAVGRNDAERFMRDHGGHVLEARPDAIPRANIEALFQR